MTWSPFGTLMIMMKHPGLTFNSIISISYVGFGWDVEVVSLNQHSKSKAQIYDKGVISSYDMEPWKCHCTIAVTWYTNGNRSQVVETHSKKIMVCSTFRTNFNTLKFSESLWLRFDRSSHPVEFDQLNISFAEIGQIASLEVALAGDG